MDVFCRLLPSFKKGSRFSRAKSHHFSRGKFTLSTLQTTFTFNRKKERKKGVRKQINLLFATRYTSNVSHKNKTQIIRNYLSHTKQVWKEWVRKITSTHHIVITISFCFPFSLFQKSVASIIISVFLRATASRLLGSLASSSSLICLIDPDGCRLQWQKNSNIFKHRLVLFLNSCSR